MLNFLVLLTILEAINLATTRTSYVNNWDERLYWTAQPNRMVTGLYSVHNNHKEDRRWKFYYGSASGLTTSDCHWSGTVNDWDKELSYTCQHDRAITGFHSWHSNHREDRRWKFQCCRVNGASLVDQGLRVHEHNWDGRLDSKCKSNEVLTGLYSSHHNHYEDRIWRIRCGKLSAQPDYPIRSSLSGYKNSWDRTLQWGAGHNGMITGFASYHDNHREDRRWRFYHGSTALRCDQTAWSGYENSWDGKLEFSCPDRAVLNGVYSYHNNHREDRRWKFKCCRFPNNVVVRRSNRWAMMNNYDDPMDWFCPNSNQAVVALYSVHSNRYEDRAWWAKCGEIVKA